MNWDRVEGQWKQKRGKAVLHWGKLMNDELAAIAGKHEQLVGVLQEKYGVAKEEANRQIQEFKHIVGKLKKSNASLMKLKTKAKPRKSATAKASANKAPARRRKAS